MVNLRKIFTLRLNEAVDTCDISKASIQRATEKSKSTVMNWFNGTNMPTPEDIEIIASVTGRDPRWFYGANEIDKSRDQLLIELFQKSSMINNTEMIQDLIDQADSFLDVENKRRKESV